MGQGQGATSQSHSRANSCRPCGDFCSRDCNTVQIDGAALEALVSAQTALKMCNDFCEQDGRDGAVKAVTVKEIAAKEVDVVKSQCPLGKENMSVNQSEKSCNGKDKDNKEHMHQGLPIEPEEEALPTAEPQQEQEEGKGHATLKDHEATMPHVKEADAGAGAGHFKQPTSEAERRRMQLEQERQRCEAMRRRLQEEQERQQQEKLRRKQEKAEKDEQLKLRQQEEKALREEQARERQKKQREFVNKKKVEAWLRDNGFQNVDDLVRKGLNKVRPLHFAVQKHNVDMVNLLLLAGADRQLLSGKKETPLQLAQKLDKAGTHVPIIFALSDESSRKS